MNYRNQDGRNSPQGRGSQRGQRFQSREEYSGDDSGEGNFGTGFSPDYQGQGSQSGQGGQYGQQSSHEDFERDHYWNQGRGGQGRSSGGFSGGNRQDFRERSDWDQQGGSMYENRYAGGSQNEGRYGSGGRQEGGYGRYGGGMYGSAGGSQEQGRNQDSYPGTYERGQFYSPHSRSEYGNFSGYGMGGNAGGGYSGGGYSGGSSGGYSGQGQGGRSQQRADRKGPKGYTRSDERVKEDLCERLTDAYDLEVENVTIEVKDGKVSISGTVPERHMKHRIEDIASTCSGVKDVENNVRVARSSDNESQSSGSSSTSSSTQQKGSKH